MTSYLSPAKGVVNFCRLDALVYIQYKYIWLVTDCAITKVVIGAVELADRGGTNFLNTVYKP